MGVRSSVKKTKHENIFPACNSMADLWSLEYIKMELFHFKLQDIQIQLFSLALYLARKTPERQIADIAQNTRNTSEQC